MKILVTGGAGYIGGLVIEKLSADPRVEKIICIDLLPPFLSAIKNKKLEWIQADLAKHGWKDKLSPNSPIDAVVHCAFKIRNPYGKTKKTEENNENNCRNVFEYCLNRNVPKLVYLGSVAAYGAKPENIGKLIKEDEALIEKENPYGYQKAVSEKILGEIVQKTKCSTRVFVLRLNSVTGPRGQGLSSKFGLITFLKKLLPFIIEANPYWARQFVHENDVVRIIEILATKEVPPSARKLEVFNVAPANFLTAKDMGRLLGKLTLKIPEWSVRPLFWIAWNVSLGRIPTRPDSSKGLIYPINVDGSSIEKIGFHYAHTSEDAFLARA